MKKIYYVRGTDELRLKNLIAHKLVQEFNNCPIENSERKDEIIRNYSEVSKDFAL